MQNIKSIKEEISKILVKWDMPTRQIAINEIVALFQSQLSTLESEVEKMKQVERWIVNTCPMIDEKAISYNKALDQVLTIIKEQKEKI